MRQSESLEFEPIDVLVAVKSEFGTGHFGGKGTGRTTFGCKRGAS